MAEKKEKEKPPSRETTLTVPQLRALRQLERRRMTQLLRRRRLTERLLVENMTVQESINQMNEEKETESLILLGGGVLVSGKIIPNTLKRTLPGNVVLPSTKQEVNRDLDERKKVLSNDLQILDKEIQQSNTNFQGVEALLQLVRQQTNKARQKVTSSTQK